MSKQIFRSALALAVVAGVLVAGGLSRATERSGNAQSAFGVYKSSEAEGTAAITPAAAAAVSWNDVIVNRGSAMIGPPGSLTATWSGQDVTASTAGPSDTECNASGAQCDDFFVSVTPAQPSGSLTIDVSVPATEDYDLYVYDPAGNELGNSGNPGPLAETVTVPCPSAAAGPYKVRVVYFTTLDDPVNAVYNATATFNNTGPCASAGTATFNQGALAFAPSTLVSAHFLGVEPQTVLERTASWTPAGNPGGIDNNRIFVDWPLSSRSNIGQLSRSLDGGDSFRLLVDQICAARNRPNCATGGGGDTESDVNLKNGSVLFADQEVLVNEAAATSTDHGDSFLFQDPAVSQGSVTDRQWIAATDNAFNTLPSQVPASVPLEGFFTYHIPPLAYVHGIPETTHLPAPQPVAQITNAGQTGQPKVDNNSTSPGHGWIYYPFRDFLGGGTSVATAPSTGYSLPSNWHVHQVTTQGANSFPWISIDSAGNAYLTWDSGGAIYYAYSLISNPLNDPTATPAGVPGTAWSPPIRISPATVGSAVFPEGTAGGDVGRLGVTYMGTTEFTGDPDLSPATTHWNVYAAVITAANTLTPTVNMGVVSHRVAHHGNICTSGTTCGTTDPSQDRSLADMIDVGFDSTGRLGVVFQDNNTASFQDKPTTPDLSPFVYFAKEITGPTLFAATSAAIVIPRDARNDPSGDATFPNTAAGTNQPGFDILRTSISMVGSNLVGRIQLSDASAAALQAAIAGYNAGAGTQPAQRSQYILRFNTATETYHLSIEVLPNGTITPFGGKLDANDGIANPLSPTSVIAAGYHRDAAFTVSYAIVANEIVFTAAASQFGVASGTELYSVTGIAAAGPLETLEQTQTGIPQNAAYVMRTVDASPPFETTIGGTTGVRLASFTASRPVKTPRTVTIKWRTGEEAGLLGFNLYREVGTSKTRLNKRLIAGKGQGVGAAYSAKDLLPQTVKAKPCYRLEAVGTDGTKSPLSRTCVKK